MHPIAGGENAIWCGGSICASSPIFKNLAVSKQEWMENGASILSVKML